MEEVWTMVMKMAGGRGKGRRRLCARRHAEKSHREGGFCVKAGRSDHFLRQFALGVLGCDDLEVVALDLEALAFAAEFQVTLLADLLGGLARRLEPLARVELLGIL